MGTAVTVPSSLSCCLPTVTVTALLSKSIYQEQVSKQQILSFLSNFCIYPHWDRPVQLPMTAIRFWEKVGPNLWLNEHFLHYLLMKVGNTLTLYSVITQCPKTLWLFWKRNYIYQTNLPLCVCLYLSVRETCVCFSMHTCIFLFVRLTRVLVVWHDSFCPWKMHDLVILRAVVSR